MRLLTPFDFLNRFPEGQTLALVGNAATLAGASLGKMIEENDVVVRFNECALEGFEDDVGQRTDILVTNPYPENRKRILLDGRAPKVVLVINPQTRRGDRQVFEQWCGELDVLFTYTPDLVGVEASEHKAGMTTGTYAAQLLWRILRPSRMLVTGFTMFLDAGPSHYWQPGQSPGIKSHDMQREASIFLRVLNSMKVPVAVTPEIAWVSRRVQVLLAPHIAVQATERPAYAKFL